MPIISKPKVFDAEYFFIFTRNEILVKSNSLVSKDEFEFFANENFSEDWYTESPLSYAAALLKDNSSVPENFSFVSVRQFCFEQKEIAFLAARAASLIKQRRMFLFCPSCRGKLIDDENESARKCPDCGTKFFPRIEPATITLVSRGDEILLVKNKNSTYKNFACVSGFVEQGETLEQCVAREVKEETNIEVKNIKYCGSQPWPFPDQLMAAFTADYKSGEIKIQESEILEARWFKKNNLPEESHLPRPGSVAWNLINGAFKN